MTFSTSTQIHHPPHRYHHHLHHTYNHDFIALIEYLKGAVFGALSTLSRDLPLCHTSDLNLATLTRNHRGAPTNKHHKPHFADSQPVTSGNARHCVDCDTQAPDEISCTSQFKESSRAAAVGETFGCSSPTYGTIPIGLSTSILDRCDPDSLPPSLDLVIDPWAAQHLSIHIKTSNDSIVDCRLSLLKSIDLPGSHVIKMDSLTTHPSTAQQATAFTSPASLSFPGGAGDLTPPSEKDGHSQANGISGQTNGINGQVHGGNAASNGNGVTPTTPAATPGAGTGVSGIVPTLQ